MRKPSVIIAGHGDRLRLDAVLQLEVSDERTRLELSATYNLYIEGFSSSNCFYHLTLKIDFAAWHVVTSLHGRPASLV